jgi:hypothetical protein
MLLSPDRLGDSSILARDVESRHRLVHLPL